ncbi:MAG: UbiA family prenyltransferase [Spirochaetia bacterium]
MSAIHKLKAYFLLARPELAFTAGICALIGQAAATGGVPALNTAAVTFVSVFLLAASVMPVNDLVDIEIDRANKPERPIASGAVSPFEAVMLAALLAAAGLAFAMILSLQAFILALSLSALGLLYNLKGKKLGLAGNAMVSICVTGTLFFGAFAAGTFFSPVLLYLSPLVFFASLASETAGDIVDVEGDRREGSNSFAVRYGKKAALILYAGLNCLLIAFAVAGVFLLLEPTRDILWILSIITIFTTAVTAVFIRSDRNAVRKRLIYVYFIGLTILVLITAGLILA